MIAARQACRPTDEPTMTVLLRLNYFDLKKSAR